MNKTGSTAIQRVFSTLDMPGHHYARLGPPNHTDRLLLAFGGAAQHAKFEAQGLRAPQIERRAKQARDLLEAEIEGCPRPCLILSGEGVSGAYTSPDMVARLGAFLKASAPEVEVIAYVRPPVSALNSVFQQRIKGGARFDRAVAPVRYRDRLEPFDEVFGREAVTLVPYGPDALAGGDVVADFAARIGVDLPGDRTLRANESLPRNATAVMAALNRHGVDFGQGQAARAAQQALVRSMQDLGGGPVALDPAVVAAALAETGDQIDWIEGRMGRSLRDSAPQTPDQVASEQDLWEVAAAQIDALEERLLRTLRTQQDPVRRVAEMLDMMRVMQMGRDGPGADRNDEG